MLLQCVRIWRGWKREKVPQRCAWNQISSRIQMRLMLVLLIKLNATAALVDYHCEEGGGGVPARVSRSHTAPTRHAPLPLSLWISVISARLAPEGVPAEWIGLLFCWQLPSLAPQLPHLLLVSLPACTSPQLCLPRLPFKQISQKRNRNQSVWKWHQ